MNKVTYLHTHKHTHTHLQPSLQKGHVMTLSVCKIDETHSEGRHGHMIIISTVTLVYLSLCVVCMCVRVCAHVCKGHDNLAGLMNVTSQLNPY